MIISLLGIEIPAVVTKIIMSDEEIILIIQLKIGEVYLSCGIRCAQLIF